MKLRTLALLASLFVTVAAMSQKQPAAATAPLPQPFLQAHTLFLAGYSGQLDDDLKPGPLGTYHAIYGILQQWGRLKLVGSPEQADICMVFDTTSATEFEYGLRAQITDCHSNAILWVSRIKVGLADETRKKSFNTALDKWVKTQLDVLFPAAATAQ